MDVLVFPDKFVRAYPKRAEIDPRAVVAPIAFVLTEAFETDAHFVAYTNELRCRLSIGLLDPEHADKLAAAKPRMTAALFDVDDPVAHDADEPARPEWLNAEETKLMRLWEAHPGFFVYRTRGGYRIVFAPAEAFALRGREDAVRWRAMYLSWCRYLERRFGIRADRACADWTRCFRAPHVVRDGVRQEWETFGDPTRLGVWAPALEPDDRVQPKKSAPAHYGRVEPVPIADPESPYGRARIRSGVLYLRDAPLSIKGETGRNVMFGVCSALVRRMRLPIDVAADLIEVVYNPRLAAAGTDTWSRSTPSRHGMSIEERLEKARDTGSVPPGNVLDEATWVAMGGEGISPW